MDDQGRSPVDAAPEPQGYVGTRASEQSQAAQGWSQASVPTANTPVVAELLAQAPVEPLDAPPEHRDLQITSDVFETLLENHFAGILVYSPVGVTLWASSVVCTMTGYTLEERVGRVGAELVHPDDIGEAQRLFLWVLEEADRTASFEQRIRHKSGRWIWVEAHIKNLLHVPAINAIIGNYHDITDRKAAHERLLASEQRQRDLANQDHLTGLGNRRSILTELERASRDLQLGRIRDFAFYFLDLDGFKKVNDRLGHAFGDEFLKCTAQRLLEAVGPNDVVARIGGDEFAILARSVHDRAAAEALGDHLVHTMADPVKIRGHLVQLPGCIGVVTAGGRDWSPQEYLRYADTALYAAKCEGTGRVRVFDEQLETQLREQTELAEEFGFALERNELDVHYQPIVDLTDRRVVGMEALVRWNHPTRGLLPAGTFIDVAEETGLVIPMGEYVFERVCADAARWATKLGDRTPWVSANLSSAQLIRQDFGDLVRSTVARHGIQPGKVRFELTERGLFETEGPWRDRLWEAEAAGVPLMLDDFGTGHTSMRYLADFPISILKLDKSYVQRSTATDPDRRERALSLIHAVSRMSVELGMLVVAEGIETPEQHQAIVDAGCHLGQGWLYDRAMTSAAVDERLRRGRWVL